MIRRMLGGEAARVGRSGVPNTRPWMLLKPGAWVRWVWAWVTNTGYRPERRYMRGHGGAREAIGRGEPRIATVPSRGHHPSR
jgi:hypothetical protein